MSNLLSLHYCIIYHLRVSSLDHYKSLRLFIAIFLELDMLIRILILILAFIFFIWTNIHILLFIDLVHMFIICNEIRLCFILEITLVDLRFRIGSLSLNFILFRLWLLKCFNSPFDNTLESGCPLWFFNKLLIGIRLLRLLDWQSIFIIELVLSRCYRVLFWANIVFSQYTFLIAFHFFFFFHFFVLGLKIR